MAQKVADDLVIQDAPPKPDIIRDTLREKSMWKRFLKLTKNGVSPEKVLEVFNSDKSKILAKVKAGEKITQKDCDFLNKRVSKNIERVLKDFQKRALAEVTVTPNDTAKEIEFKMGFADKSSG